MKSHQLVYVGAVDWKHPQWMGGYYPEGLPDDWLLSYYNTQFQAVYLPASFWQSASSDTWKQWLHDTQESFVFVLEPGDMAIAKPVSERVLLASSDWEASHVWWLDESPDLRVLAQRITQQAATGESLFVLSRKGDMSLLDRVNSLRQVMGY